MKGDKFHKTYAPLYFVLQGYVPDKKLHNQIYIILSLLETINNTIYNVKTKYSKHLSRHCENANKVNFRKSFNQFPILSASNKIK